jgi:hypothetical protein
MYYNSATDSIEIYSGSAWRKVVNSITKGGSYTDAITIGESNGTVTLTLNLADTDSAGLLSADFWNALTDATSDATASKLVKRDANGNIKVATPTDDAHAATKGYVDAARAGLDVKQSVRVATTEEINLSTSAEAGDVIDGVTLVAGNRILVKNQTLAYNNGIYVVQETGALVRSTDMDSGGPIEVSGGTFTFVEEGSVNADSGWVVSSNGNIIPGMHDMNWVQFSGAGQITAGDGLTKSGNTINVVGTADRITANADSVDIASTYAGQNTITTLGTITTGVWNGTDVAVADGGTGSGTASGARTNLAETPTSGQTTSAAVLSRVVHQACAASSGTTSVTTVTHNFNTKNVIVQVYQVSNGETVTTDVARATVDSVTVTINGSTIASDDYHIVVTG